ncbi:MAG: hypothetical protein ACREUL_09655 [Steroidobacteraceae bacterium]
MCAATLGAALVMLSGCAWGRLAAEPPPGERLAGDWKLDAAHSDDLGKAVAQLRAQAAKAHRKSRGGPQQGFAGYGRRAGGGAPGGQHGGQAESSPGSGTGAQEFGPGATPHVSAVDELMSNVPQGDYLGIAVSPDTFTVTSGDSSNQYAPGLESDISAEQGDAQQISGWKGTAYVIDTTPQFGPEVIQRFELTKDGKLEMTVRLSGSGAHFTFTRVYDRTTRVAPLAPPTIN